MTTSPGYDEMKTALEAARKFVRGRLSYAPYGPQKLLDQIDAALKAADVQEETDMRCCECKHENAERSASGIFDYCPDCGAVRRLIRGNLWDQWHVCDLCRLPEVTSG